MAMCERCGRGPLKGHSVSHSNVKTIRRQKLNLQIRHIGGKTLLLCTNCIKTMLKVPRQRSAQTVSV